MALDHDDRSPRSESPSEIQARLRRRFLERLAQRVKKIRMSQVERDWSAIRSECRQLRGSGDNFGFPQLKQACASAEAALPQKEIPRAASLPEVRQAIEQLVSTIDQILMENSSTQ